MSVRLRVDDKSSYGNQLAAFRATLFTQRLLAQDPTLWGPDAQEESRIRLSWVDAPDTSRELLEPLEDLRRRLQHAGITRVVLCGMGGSSLAPELICRSEGVQLEVLDSSQPDMVRSAIHSLDKTLVVVSSKSGGTVETDSHRRIFEQAFNAEGLHPADHLIVVTDPGSPLDRQAAQLGYRVFHADPHVGGRFSALTAFGLVPSILAGAGGAELLDQAAQTRAELAAEHDEDDAVSLGVAIGVAAKEGVDKLVLLDRGQTRLGDWIEQLIAESTGKDGTGILPVVVESTDYQPTDDSFVIHLGTDELPDHRWCAAIDGPLGSQFMLWEVATAAAGRILGIDPFDQPDVESAKAAAREVLDHELGDAEPDPAADIVSIFGSKASTVGAAITELLSQVPADGYLSLQFYLNRWAGQPDEALAEKVASKIGRPVTFGWGPRFLHSTGQFHKGGTPNGVFLQVTCDPITDLEVPGRDFTLGEFIASQAAGDAQVLRERGRPVLQLHLHDVPAGLALITEALA
ncbi:MAG TPA: glucose-6-phosphate isomerase [Aeromicrobium sp.]|nr:glucose-6-phosphate isomerase [Aeromicrobium sp.]